MPVRKHAWRWTTKISQSDRFGLYGSLVRDWRVRKKLRRYGLGYGLDIVLLRLSSQKSFCFIAMPLILSVFLVCILNRDLLVHKKLAVEVGNCIIGRFKIRERYESIPLREVGLVASDLESLSD